MTLPDADAAVAAEPQMTEMRFSLTHDGWFWTVEVANPWPRSRFDQRVIKHGYARRKWTAERKARRAIKSLNRRMARAVRAQHDAGLAGERTTP